MSIGFPRTRLSLRLAAFISFPVLASFVLLSFILVNERRALVDTWLIAIAFAFLSLYSIAAFMFLRDLIAGIKHAKAAAENLSDGKFSSNGVSSNFEEIDSTLQSIQKTQAHFQAYEGFAQQIKEGKLADTFPLRYEGDRLGSALQAISSNLINIRQADERRNWSSESLAKFVGVLQSAKDLKMLCNDVVVNLVRTVNASHGAMFLLNEGEQVLEMQACYAFNKSKQLTKKILPGEGLVGQAFLEKETTYLNGVPEKFLRITSGLGGSNARHVLIVPLKLNQSVVGVLELASFSEFNKHVIEFVETIGESIAHSVKSFQIAENTSRMLQESQTLTQEMKAKEEELRQNQEELQATQEAISKKYEALFEQLSELNYESKFDQLKSITSTKKRNVEYYFDIIRNQILTFSQNLMVVEAMKSFCSAFYKTSINGDPARISAFKQGVASYYATEFIPRLNNNVSRQLRIEDYLPTDPIAVNYQYLFISNNPHPTGSKMLLDAAEGGGEYSDVHARYHPIMRTFLEKFGYYDIFLIDSRTGYMVYSVFKEVDFATNLLDGPYCQTNFGKVVREIVDNTEREFVKLIDFEPYDPSYHAPASFIASAVYDGDEKIGVLVFQMPINKINQILTGDNKWRQDGLGETGETIVIGSDYKLRSISRPLVENPAGHVSRLRQFKYPPEVLQQISAMQTNILMEEIRTESVAQALQGSTGVLRDKDQFGENVLTSYSPLDVADVHWMIMSSMTEREASMRIQDLKATTK